MQVIEATEYGLGNEYVYFDIETIPTQSPEMRKAVVDGIKPPSNYKDEAKIAAYKEEKAEDVISKTAFDGFLGHVICVSWDAGNGVQTLYAETVEQERELVAGFFSKFGPFDKCTLVGHNSLGFDIPFMTRAALRMGIKLPIARVWPRNPRPWDKTSEDTMQMAGDMIGMDKLCGYLGIEGKDGFDGSMVEAAWLNGEHDKIREYCAADVSRTKALHEKFLGVGW